MHKVVVKLSTRLPTWEVLRHEHFIYYYLVTTIQNHLVAGNPRRWSTEFIPS